MYIKKGKESSLCHSTLFSHWKKNKYNIWKKSCQYSISQDTEGGNSTCREKVGKLACKLNPPHTLLQKFYNKRIKYMIHKF